MFDWLVPIIDAILSVIPRLSIVRRTHAHVKWGATGRATLWTHKNGMWGLRALHVYWPILSDVTEFPIERQTAHGGPQRLTLADGRTDVGVEWMVVYKIVDPLAYAVKCWDAEDVIDDVASGAAKKVVVACESLSVLCSHETDVALTRAIRSELREYGVKVRYAKFTSAAKVRNIALWGVELGGSDGE